MTASQPIASTAPRLRWGRYAGLLVAPGVGTYGFNVVTATMPQLATELRASAVEQELVVAAYGIPFAALLILGGRLGDRVGRRPLFLVGMSLFAGMALVAALAPDAGILVAARAVQGIGAALCTPQVLGTIQATSTGADRIRLISIFGASGGIGAALGQVLGGVLAGLDLFGSGWRASYAVAALIAAVAVALAVRAPRSRSSRPAAMDVAGTLELLGGIVLVVAAVTFGPGSGWSWPTIASLLIGLALLVVLWHHQGRIERSGRMPLLPPSVLRLRPLQLGLVMAALFFSGYGALLFVLSRSLEDGLHVDPVVTGLTLVPFATLFAIVSVGVGRIQSRLGDATLPVGVVLQVAALALGATTVVLFWGPWLPVALQPALLVLGAGQALIVSPLTQLVVREIPDAAAGLSGGMFSTVQQLALALGVIVFGSIAAALGFDARQGLLAGLLGDAGLAFVVLVLAALFVATTRRSRRSLAGDAGTLDQQPREGTRCTR